MNWGHKIALSFVLFAAFILYMVVRAFQQEISLVSEDYYAQEIAYQTKMQKKANLISLGDKVEVSVKSDKILIQFPGAPSSGEIHFYHPSKSGLDRKYVLNLENQNIQSIDRCDLAIGSYKVKLTWTSKGTDYFQQENIFIR